MKIIGIEGMTGDQLSEELKRGGKFVIYFYCISMLLVTFKQPSSIHFIRAGESAAARGLGFSGISLLLGWWGIPWGPIYTIGSFWTNFHGGQDVTLPYSTVSGSPASENPTRPAARCPGQPISGNRQLLPGFRVRSCRLFEFDNAGGWK